MTNLKTKIGCNRSYYDSKTYFGLQVGNSCPSSFRNKDDKLHNAFLFLSGSIIHMLTRDVSVLYMHKWLPAEGFRFREPEINAINYSYLIEMIFWSFFRRRYK